MARISKVKHQICEHAKRLFNEKGYGEVSLREIAVAAGTSIGNLTYHFPQKEDLLEAIQADLHTGFADTFFIVPDKKSLLGNLYQSFEEADANERMNPFYYRHLQELCQESKAIAQNNERFRKRLYQYYTGSFLELKAQGLIRDDIGQKQYESLAYTMVVMATVWIQSGSPYYDEALPRIGLLDALCNSIYPYLTADGIKQWNALRSKRECL